MSNGAKADNLRLLFSRYPSNVPPFVVVPFDQVIASYDVIRAAIQEDVTYRLTAKKFKHQPSSTLVGINSQLKLDQAQVDRYFQTVQAAGWQKVSYRTSALTEDGSEYSFAGQYVSFVNQAVDRVTFERSIIECFVSLFSERVLSYAAERRIKQFEIGGSMIVQKMYFGSRSGVLFSENGNAELTLAYSDSWHNTIVEGGDAQTCTINKYHIGRLASDFRKLVGFAFELEKEFGGPVDIEWSLTDHKVMLLQVRLQTTSTTSYGLTWDGTNISENYPGITLPLTYSFIRGLYAHVYPAFFRLIGMSKRMISERSWVFDNVLGYVNGRVYYQIDNWYEIVRMIPGTRNQEFFEAMLNPAKKRGVERNSWRSFLHPRLFVMALRFLWLLAASGRYLRRFKRKFRAKFNSYERLSWEKMNARSLLDTADRVRGELLELWAIPILNDIRVMIFHGLFRTVVLKNRSQQEYLQHLQGLDEQASIKPLRALCALGVQIREVMEVEKVGSLMQLQSTKSWPVLLNRVRQYVDDYGGRTPDELKLEYPRLGENIDGVLKLAYMSRDKTIAENHKNAHVSFRGLSFGRRLVAPYVARQMRHAIDHRERFRFNRAQVFGVARRAYLAIGARFVEAGVIVGADDIFYLTEDEIRAIIHGHSWAYDFREIVEQRKKQYASYEKRPFWLRATGEGTVPAAHVMDATPLRAKHTEQRNGMGVAPGRVTAPVVVVADFDPELDIRGKILVARHIDPGWTLLLVQAAGVITERGNALSHVAIVSRELGVPAIVGMVGAVSTLHTGDTLSMNGTTGEISHES